MSLHFLLKAEARTRSLVEVLGMSDDDAFTLFRRVRWGDGDEVICPHCGLVHRHYFRPARQIWRCVVLLCQIRHHFDAPGFSACFR